MDNILNMNDFLGAAEADSKHVLGKFLYFPIPRHHSIRFCPYADILSIWILRKLCLFYPDIVNNIEFQSLSPTLLF